MEGHRFMRTMQYQMVTLSGELGRGIMNEIKSTPIKPYSELHRRAMMVEAEVLKERAIEKKGKKGTL